MTKKIEYLTQELQELFPEKDAKKLSDTLGTLSDIRGDFTASKNFKRDLKTRLKNIHSMQAKSSFSLISFFKYSGVFASFLFVSGATYIYYSIQQEGIHEAIEVQIQDDISQESTTQDIQTSLPALPQGDGISASPEKIQIKNTPVLQKQSSPPQTSQKSLDTQDSLSQFQESQEVSHASINDSKISGESMKSGNMRQMPPENLTEREHNSQDEYILTDIMNIFEASPQDEVTPSLQDENPSSEMMLKGASPMMFGVDPFFELCQSYSGSLSPDGEKCFFGSENFCTRENIFSESETKCEYISE